VLWSLQCPSKKKDIREKQESKSSQEKEDTILGRVLFKRLGILWVNNNGISTTTVTTNKTLVELDASASFIILKL